MIIDMEDAKYIGWVGIWTSIILTVIFIVMSEIGSLTNNTIKYIIAGTIIGIYFVSAMLVLHNPSESR